MKTIFFSGNAQFNLTDEEFNDFIKKANNGEKVWIPRLKVFLSNMFIWAGEKPEDPNVRKLKDGTVATKKGGNWFCNYSGAKLDLKYYPELAKDINDKDIMNVDNY